MEYLLKMSSITYKEDIIKELSEELNIPEKELKEIVDLNIGYIKKIIKENNILVINVPNLCKLRLNNRLAYSYMNRNKNSTVIKRKQKVDILKKKLELFTRYQEENSDWRFLTNVRKPLFERLWKKVTMYKYINNINFKMYKIIEGLEKETNIIIEKIK